MKKIWAFVCAVAIVFGVINFVGAKPQTAKGATTAPATITYNESNGSLVLNWNKISGADSYEIYRAGSHLGQYQSIANTKTNSFVDTHCNEDKYKNYYKISALDDGSSEIWSTQISLEKQIFGQNIYFYDAEFDNVEDVLAEVNAIHDDDEEDDDDVAMFNGQFSTKRYAMYFKEGSYEGAEEFRIGFYTQMAGLGKYPTDVKLGGLDAPPHLGGGNATCTFWRSMENLSITDRTFYWRVSQATWARRMQIEVPSNFISLEGSTTWGSGGYVADTKFTETANFGGQQQWYTRNTEFAKVPTGGSYNMVYQGCVGAGTSNTSGSKTVIDEIEMFREKPFLYMDEGEYKVFVPAFTQNPTGTSWDVEQELMGEGESLDLLESFYIAKPDVDNDETINKALKEGKNIFFTPGHYYVDNPIQVNRKDAILLGTGYATIVPTEENTYGAMLVDDIDGAIIAGLLFDAYNDSTYLIRIGDEDADADHSEDPVMIIDVVCRIGGVISSNTNADVAMQINSNNVIGDHFWLWRADHGSGVGWERNTCKNGLIVTGDDVTCYGLFVEHFQEYQTLWMGNGGKVYFYQNETPYDPINQDAWMSHDGTVKGYSAYKIANNVTTHKVVGLGMYEVLNRIGEGSVAQQNAMEVPDAEGVEIINACTARFAGSDGILSVINGAGGSTASSQTRRITNYCNGVVQSTGPKTITLPEDEVFVLPSNDRPTYIVMDGSDNLPDDGDDDNGEDKKDDKEKGCGSITLPNFFGGTMLMTFAFGVFAIAKSKKFDRT